MYTLIDLEFYVVIAQRVNYRANWSILLTLFNIHLQISMSNSSGWNPHSCIHKHWSHGALSLNPQYEWPAGAGSKSIPYALFFLTELDYKNLKTLGNSTEISTGHLRKASAQCYRYANVTVEIEQFIFCAKQLACAGRNGFKILRTETLRNFTKFPSVTPGKFRYSPITADTRYESYPS
jgi:hypothetical protein